MSRSRTCEALRTDIEHIPVIDTHEHFTGPEDHPKYTEPIASLVQGYYSSDLVSAGGAQAAQSLADDKVPTEEKWPLFEKLWARTKHTGYARVIRLILQNEYGLKDLTLAGLKSIAEGLIDLRDRKAFDAQMDRYGIRCCLVNIRPNWKEYVAQKRQLHPQMKVLIRGPDLHNVRTFQAVQDVAGWVNRRVTCLEEYLDAVREFCRRMKELGAVGIKDQSAYERIIRYDSGTRAEAERLFGFLMDDPRCSLGWPESKPLDDCIFHAVMRIARDLELPVQVHTGHMAGVCNDVAKTNAAHFRSVLELHQDVRFDLFHGNWPYAGDWLFLGKNYANVSLNCCWLHVIDPRYSRRVLADALVTVPHSKVHGFGGDYRQLEHSCAHLVVARDNIAAALAGMVDDGWLDMDEARQAAADWLFNNANEFYRLGLEPVRV